MPKAAPVVDWGAEPPFIALELMDGPVLSREISARRQSGNFWSEDELVAHYLELCRGLESINAQVIHRDLKPDNIFVAADSFKVSDFGLSKFVGEATRTLTFKGGGTTAYMAPEAIRAESVNWFVDQYSLGIVFFEMATLRLPFAGDGTALEHAHLFKVPDRINVVRPEISTALATVVSNMLEKDVADRYQTWADVISALKAAQVRGVQGQASITAGRAAQFAQEAAAQIDARRTAELEAKRLAEERTARSRHRIDLLQHWISKFYRAARSEIDAINASLNSDRIKLSPAPSLQGAREARFSFTFLDKTAEIYLSPFPLDASEKFTLWGYGKALTHKHRWATNLLVDTEPLPYGRLRSFDLRRNAWVPDRGTDDFEGTGALYERVVPDYAIALNAEAVLAQAGLIDTMSLLQWEEGADDLAAILAQPLEALVKGAGEPPPPPPPQAARRRPRSPFDGMR